MVTHSPHRRGLWPCVSTLLMLATSGAAPYLAGASNPAPTVASINPYIVPAGATTAVTLTGAGFLPSSTVSAGGKVVTSTYKSSTMLVASVTTVAGTQPNLAFTIENPAPGGGVSEPVAAAVSSPISLVEATRVLDETTFGPTSALIAHVQAEGLNAWLAEQYNTPPTVLPLTPYGTAKPVGCASAGYCIESTWWTAALGGEDQLRQRVAFALSQIFVISDGSNPSASITPYANMLATDAFTNWSTIMNDVALSPGMGDYLNMLNSAVAPAGQIANENFARENMQLFNLGLYLLNPDGTQQIDSTTNEPIPTYTELQVEAFAKAYTGWTFATRTGVPQTGFTTEFNYNDPMVAIASQHDGTQKVLLNGTTLPAGQTAEADFAQAQANVFNHPNVAPFVCRQLIQHLVGYPSPAYVARVATVFNNDGAGVRGNMQAVLSAIFNDPSARHGDSGTNYTEFGHLREPVLFTTHLLRAVGYTNTNPEGYWVPLWQTLRKLGEGEYTANSVFNFFPPNYIIPSTALNSPEFGIENTGSIGQRRTLADSLLNNDIAGVEINLGPDSPLVQLAADPTSLVNELGALFAHSELDPKIRTAVINEISTVTDPAQRARIAIYLIATAPINKIEY